MTNPTNTTAAGSAYAEYVKKLFGTSSSGNEDAFEQVLIDMKNDARLNGCTINDIFQEKIRDWTILEHIIIDGGTGAIRLLDIATKHGLTITDKMLDNIQNLYNTKHKFSLTRKDNYTQSQNFINILKTYAQQNPQQAYNYILNNFNKDNTGKKFFAELRLTLATAISRGANPTIKGLELFCETQLAYADGNAEFIHENKNLRFDAYKTLKEAIKKYKENPNDAEIINSLIEIIDRCKSFHTSSSLGADTNAELTALDKFKTMIVEGNTNTRTPATSTRTPATSTRTPATSTHTPATSTRTPSPSVTTGPSNDVRHAKGTNTQNFWDKKFLGLSVRAWAWIIGGLIVGGLAYGAFRKGGWLNKDKGKSKLSSIASSGQSTGQGSTGSSQTPTLPIYQDSVTQQTGSGSTLEIAGSVLTATSITGGVPPSHTR